MIVRCGRCGVELEVAGPGEFVCPQCGTRNAVREQPLASPFGVPDLKAPPPGADAGPPPGVHWVVCPACSYRFAAGELEEVACPACSAQLRLDGERAEVIAG